MGHKGNHLPVTQNSADVQNLCGLETMVGWNNAVNKEACEIDNLLRAE